MALSPYARRVARIQPPDILRWPDMPVGAVRQVAIDAADWAGQVDSDDPTGITVAVTPSESGGLSASAEAITGGTVAGCTIEGGNAGTDYAVAFTLTTPGGRVEVFVGRVLVTDPTA